MDTATIAQNFVAIQSRFPWIADQSPAPRAIGTISYDDLLNTYHTETLKALAVQDPTCESGMRFLKDLEHRLLILNSAHQLTPDDNVCPEAVLRGNRAAFKHCALVGETPEQVQSRLQGILAGTQTTPFVKANFLRTRTVHEGPKASSEVSLWENSDREVAVKRYKRTSVNLKVIPAYGFWMELGLTLGTSNPHIVRGHDFGAFTENPRNTLYPFDLCMESALQGLHQFMMGDEKEDFIILGALISLYAAAHRGELSPGTILVLRDIKPGNVLVFQNRTFKLCDLALAVYSQDLNLQDSSGNRIGSVGYIPPEAEVEVLDTEEPIFKNKTFIWSTRGDVYSLGSTLLYKLLNRGFHQPPEPAFTQTILDFLKNPQNRKFKGISEVLKPLLIRCLTSDLTDTPTGRYQNIDEVEKTFKAIC